MKLVINKCYGGFSLSERAIELYFKKKGMNLVIETNSRFGLKHYYINEVSDDSCMWLTPYNPFSPPFLELEFESKIYLSSVKLWNYNRSDRKSTRLNSSH